jgi:hypothetical protein
MRVVKNFVQVSHDTPGGDNVVAFSGESFGGVGLANSQWSGGYQQPDKFDSTGRRLNPDGSPQTAKPPSSS